GRPALAAVAAAHPSAGGPGAVPPGSVRWSLVRPPSDARSSVVHRPGRTDRDGWTAACKVTYLRGPSGCRSAVFPSGGVCRPERVRTMCEAAELLWPGSVGVKHWAG